MLTEFERKAWETRTAADQSKPDLAMKVALDKYEQAEVKPVHAIIVFVHQDNDDQSIEFFQAGTLTTFGVEGALARCIRVSQEND